MARRSVPKIYGKSGDLPYIFKAAVDGTIEQSERQEPRLWAVIALTSTILTGIVQRCIRFRKEEFYGHSDALRHGDYKQLHVAQEQFAFVRSVAAETVVVALNAASSAASLDFAVPMAGGTFVDMLEPERHFTVRNGRLVIESISACSARILLWAA